MTIVVILLGAFLINYLLDACFRSLWAKKLTVRVKFQDQPAMEGEEARLTETIANEKRCFFLFCRWDSGFIGIYGLLTGKIPVSPISVTNGIFFLWEVIRKSQEPFPSGVPTEDIMRWIR